MPVQAEATRVITLNKQQKRTDNSLLIPDSGSFRDRNNRVYDDGTRIIRGISKEANEIWLKLSSEPLFRDLLKESKVIGTQTLDPDDLEFHADQGVNWPAYLVHERIPFISYPYEWSFSMLKDAAILQLELIERSIDSQWTMKDATSYNIQWIGSKPVFIDIPSFEPYSPGTPWIGYRQFCMMFLYPLMLQAYKGIDFQTLLRGNLEGIEPEQANRMLSGLSRLRKGVLSHVYLHAKMHSRYSNMDLDEATILKENSEKKVSKPKQIHHSKAMVLGTIQSMKRVVKSLKTEGSRSTWSDYDTTHSYNESSFEIKKSFVKKAVSASSRQLVWDLGCNTGTFSRLCAKHSDYVIAADGDPKAIDRLYNIQKNSYRKQHPASNHQSQ